MAVLALGVAIALPLYYAIRKRNAARGLAALIEERFRRRDWNPLEIKTARGRVRCLDAYDDTGASGLMLVTGQWIFGPRSFMRVAGLLRPGGGSEWLEHMRQLPGVILAERVELGALVMFGALASRKLVEDAMSAAATSGI